MLLFPTRFMYPEQLRPFLEKEQAYGEICTTTAESAKGRTLLVSYRKSYAAEQGFVVEILDIEVVTPLARAA